MVSVRFQDWRDTNARRKYPFADGVPAASDEVTLPDDLFVDGRLYPVGGNAELYLSRITKDANALTFAIRATGTDELATASFTLDDIPANGELVFSDTYSRPAGVLVSSEVALQSLSGIDVGIYEFTLAETEFAAAVNTSQPSPGVRGFLLPSGDVMTGAVWFVGEDGVVLRRDGNAIRVDVIGDPFAARKLCEDEEANEEVAPLQPYCPIKTLNVIAPDNQGNFQLLVGSNQSLTPILRITPQSDSGSAVTETIEGADALAFATLKIEMLGERRLRGT